VHPAVIDECAPQHIEQFRITGPIPVQAKVVGSRDQPLAKIMLPKSIHHDAGGQGMVWASEPASQVEAIEARMLLLGLGRILDALVWSTRPGLRRFSLGHPVGGL